MTVPALARALNVSASTIRDIVRERRNITAVMAIRLGRYFGTSAQLWMNLQSVHSLAKAYAECGDEIEREIEPFRLTNQSPPLCGRHPRIKTPKNTFKGVFMGASLRTLTPCSHK